MKARRLIPEPTVQAFRGVSVWNFSPLSCGFFNVSDMKVLEGNTEMGKRGTNFLVLCFRRLPTEQQRLRRRIRKDAFAF